jgi:hypothetical protein
VFEELKRVATLKSDEIEMEMSKGTEDNQFVI